METLFSFAFLLLVMILLLNLYPTSLTAVHRTEQQLQAETLAESILADQSALPFDSLVVPTSTDLPTQRIGSVDYNPHLEIFDFQGHDRNHLKGLRVTVSWDERTVHHEAVQELWVHHLAQ